MASDFGHRGDADRLREAGFLSPDEHEVVLERIAASEPRTSLPLMAPPVGQPAPLPPPSTAPTAPPLPPPAPAAAPNPQPVSRPLVVTARPKRSTQPYIVCGLLISVVAGALIWFATRTETITAKVSMVVLGDDCSSTGYGDVDQVVVKNSKGDEVAFADLDVADEGSGHCAYEGSIDITDKSTYFIVGSRSETRSGLRLTRSEVKQGIELSIGECVSDLDVAFDDVDTDASADCFAYMLTEAGATEN